MRQVGAFLLAALSLSLPNSSCAPSPSLLHASDQGVAIYEANRGQLWNRLHSVIFVRADVPGTDQMPDALDPPLWPNSKYLLAQPSHDRMVRILDEFLETHGERVIRDPTKRAMLQRDLWAVFDWSVEREPQRPEEPAYEKEKTELQLRLVEVMRRIALTPEEIHALPSNYAQAVASRQFTREYDPAHPDRPFLPPDLLDMHSSWVPIAGNGLNEPVAASHTRTFSRSTFLVFLRLPTGRKATFDYLQALWDFPRPWVPRPDDDRHEQTSENPDLPQFPVGTQVALVRQMLLFDNQGNLQATPITESVQLRVYHSIDPLREETFGGRAEAVKKSGQDFYQFELSRRQLFAGQSGGVKATGRDEREFGILNAFGPDFFPHPLPLNKLVPVLETCFECHRGAGINSLNTRNRLLKPNWLQHEFPPGAYDPAHPWWEYENTYWKQNRYEWGLLSGYWKAKAGSHN